MTDIPTDATLNKITSDVAHFMKTQSLKLVTAESCTGGWIAKCCTDLSGSSAWFERGFVTYSNEAKQSELHVPAKVITEHGAVSEPVVKAMALGALTHSKADISVSISGIAGPSGGSELKPVGTVWIAWAQRDGGVKSTCYQFKGDREAVRRQSVFKALEGILKNASETAPSMG